MKKTNDTYCVVFEGKRIVERCYRDESGWLKTWILQAATTATEAATGLNTCTFNLAIAVGSLSASVVGGSGAISGVLWLAAALVALTSFVVWRAPAR